ncbi:sugar transferase [Streptomyces sp. PR69]|uniref:sugar transferase n=1 Tax=Streptomyces sp. PR69 TaxID=2984950 RepID=UPI002264118F|nr:sugar transferase [Streptomyces sp. PR69]
MTTESASAPHSAQATAVHRPAAGIHPQRHGPAGSAPVPVRARGAGPRGAVAALLTADLLALATALALTLALPGSRLPRPELVFVLLAAAQLALHAWRGLYRPQLSPSALAELPALGGLALLQWSAGTQALAYHTGRPVISWTALGCAAAAQTLLSCLSRAVAYQVRRDSAARRPQSALVVGRGRVAQQIVAALYEHPEYGLRPVGRVEPGREQPGDGDRGVTGGDLGVMGALPVLGAPEDVSRAVIQNTVRQAVVTQPPGACADTDALVALLSAHGCRMWLVDGGPASGDRPGRAYGRDHLWGFSVRPLHGGGCGLDRPAARLGKRAMDTVLAGLALLAAAPVMAVCALAVRLSDGPGVLFRQERIGLHGRPFTLLKFRTIRPVDEHESATRWTVAHDQRMSAAGSLLRRSSMDELPQLWNVLRGDMSLVGPRPERPYFVAKFSHAHPGYQARHRMPVGITGLAQINGLRGDTSIEDRARFDNHYIETWTLWQDVCILLRTAGSLFRLGGS